MAEKQLNPEIRDAQHKHITNVLAERRRALDDFMAKPDSSSFRVQLEETKLLSRAIGVTALNPVKVALEPLLVH